MAGETTALVFVGPRATGGEDEYARMSHMPWKVGHVAAFTEKFEPSWVITAAGFASSNEGPFRVVLSEMNPRKPMIEQLVLALACQYGLPLVQQVIADDHRVLRKAGSHFYIAPRRGGASREDEDDSALVGRMNYPTDMVHEECMEFARNAIRLGIVYLGKSMLQNESPTRALRDRGFVVSEFSEVINQ